MNQDNLKEVDILQFKKRRLINSTQEKGGLHAKKNDIKKTKSTTFLIRIHAR
jgi:hypothetical protein